MTYIQNRNSADVRRRTVVGSVILLVGFLAVLIRLIWPAFFPAIFLTLAKPFWRSEFSLRAGSLKTPESLLMENESLKRQLAEDLIRLETVQSVERENSDLKSILGRASTTPYVLAAVIYRPPRSAYDELIIDAGKDLDFAVGDKVYAPGNILIGQLSEVVSQTSVVRLLSSPNEKYPVLVGPNHAQATAIGRGGGQYEIELPRDIKVTEGDFVNLASVHDRPFGRVTAVLADPARPFTKVLFVPPFNLYEMRWVLVDTRTKTDQPGPAKK